MRDTPHCIHGQLIGHVCQQCPFGFAIAHADGIERHEYVYTDGIVVAEHAMWSEDELQMANERAQIATGGTWRWELREGYLY
jgi:hypothetical protein